MFYIVEEQESLNRLINHSRKGAYVEIITSNDNYHPKLTSIVALFIQPLDLQEGFILPFNHTEGFISFKESVSDILSQISTIYTIDRKKFLYHSIHPNIIDLSLLYSMTKFEKLDTEVSLSSINWFYSRYEGVENLNQIIPISLLHQRSQKLYDKVKRVIDMSLPKGFDFYNTMYTNVFYLIEQQGLRVSYEAFNNLFTPKNINFNTRDNITYTYYNLYNSTGRPTNAFNSVNFAAIPKTDEYRKVFSPQNDMFVELDFDGYHLRLLCDRIGYELTEESAHKQLARLYFGKEEVTEEEYSKAKQINFQAIYGKIPEEHKHLVIFREIQKYINGLWKEYEDNGVIFDSISEKPFTKELKDMHPAKLMNYTMQSLETSRNVLILKKVLDYLKNKKTKIALYTYDAILFDFSKEDGKQTLEELTQILEENSKYPTRFKYNTNLV